MHETDDENGRPSDWIQKQIDIASAEIASWPAWKRTNTSTVEKTTMDKNAHELLLLEEIRLLKERIAELQEEVADNKVVIEELHDRISDAGWDLRNARDNYEDARDGWSR